MRQCLAPDTMARMYTRLRWRGVLAALLPLAVAAPAGASDPLDAVETHFRKRGALAVTEVARSFLFEGQSTAHAEHLATAGCIGYLALGLGEVRDVDLALYTRAGQRVAQDIAVAPYAYARVCGAAGLDLYASATLYAGKGQLVLWRIEHAPRELGRLPASIPLAVSAGGRLEELRSVGAATDEFSSEATLLQEERANLLVGYSAGTPRALEVRAGSARGQLLLRGGRCYRVSAIVPLSRGVALELQGPASTQWSSRTTSDDRAAVAVCVPADGAYDVRVQARSMRATALVRAFEHPGVDPRRVSELGEANALAVAEADHVAKARGMSLVYLGNAWVEGATPMVWSLEIEESGCFALAALAEVGAAAIDLRLIDANGVMIAHNEGRRGIPMVFACLEEPGAVRLMMKARGPDLRVTVWRGQPVEVER
jgi:hypothetical protein